MVTTCPKVQSRGSRQSEKSVTYHPRPGSARGRRPGWKAFPSRARVSVEDEISTQTHWPLGPALAVTPQTPL